MTFSSFTQFTFIEYLLSARAGDSDAADYLLNGNSRPLPTGHMAALCFSAPLAVRCGPVTELPNEVGAEGMCALPGHFSKRGASPPTPQPPPPAAGHDRARRQKGPGPNAVVGKSHHEGDRPVRMATWAVRPCALCLRHYTFWRISIAAEIIIPVRNKTDVVSAIPELSG